MACSWAKRACSRRSRKRTGAATERVAGWWRAIGARVRTLGVAEHDQLLAFTSHLPHLVAFTMMGNARDAHFDYVGGGFRDFTRIAESSADLWVDIFRANRGALLDELRAFEAALAAACEALEKDAAPDLRAMIETANTLRRRLQARLDER